MASNIRAHWHIREMSGGSYHDITLARSFNWRVYCSASIALIWPRNSNELSERTFDDMHELSEDVEGDGTVPGQYSDARATSNNPQRWEVIRGILCRLWFRRIWIVQEALSARTNDHGQREGHYRSLYEHPLLT